MANEPTGETPVQKPSDKSVAQHPRRRSNRSGRQTQKTAEPNSAAQQGNPESGKPASQPENRADRQTAAPQSNSTASKSPTQQGNLDGRKPASKQRNAASRKPTRHQNIPVLDRSFSGQSTSSDRKTPPSSGNSADRKLPSRWTWRDFVLQFSVVVAGIVVTFVGSGLISRWARAREVKSVMQLVVSELEVNRNQMHRTTQRLIQERHGKLMFISYGFDVDVIPEDSLRYYNEPHPIGASVGLTLRSDALEVLKTSSAISSVGDKELLLEVLGCYNRLDAFGPSLDEYNNMKMNALNHFFASMSLRDMNQFSIGSNQMYDSWRVMLADPVCRSFMGFTVSFLGDDDTLNKRVADVDQTIALIKKKYNIK